MKWESAATFSSPTSISLAFPVAGGRKIELAVAPFLSSGRGSHETTTMYTLRQQVISKLSVLY
ncbi:hypothetical protein NC652_035617 [Populus alba x Populus x berolinensis]|nr:hypothetical protein NC652_035617 [Populus alba x Populus x berolinensis]